MGALSLAVRDLKRRKGNTAIAIVSVIIGISTFLAIQPLAEQFKVASIGSYDVPIVVSESRSWFEIWASFESPEIPESELERIQNIDGVNYTTAHIAPINAYVVSPTVEDGVLELKRPDTLNPQAESNIRTVEILGIDTELENMWWYYEFDMFLNESVVNGSYFDSMHMTGFCLVSANYLRREVLNLSAGDTVIVNDNLEDKGVSQTRESRIVSSPATHKKMEFHVLGIIDYGKINTTKTENYIQADILICLRDAQDLFNVDHDKVSEIYIRADPTKINDIVLEINEESDLAIYFLKTGEMEAATTAETANKGTILLAFLAVGIVIFVIMMTRIYERVKDIGIMGSFGATVSKIILLFLFEAIFIGIMGGIGGLLVAVFMANVLGIVNIGITMNTVLMAFFISIGICVIATLLPAFKAAMYDPLLAMKYGLESSSEVHLGPIYRGIVGFSEKLKKVYLTMSVKNLFRRFTRTVFTILGITVGIALFVYLMVTSNGIISQLPQDQSEIRDYQLALAMAAIIIGSLGILNTMITSVYERRKEIGTMVAIGAQPKHILKMFLYEALIIGLLGGIFGALFGILFSFIPFYGKLSFPWMTAFIWAGVGILFSVGVSIIASTYPAYKASKMTPVEAFSHEF